MNKLETDKLLIAIEGDCPAGEDIEYLPVYAEIRNARQNDPDYISHGEWAVSEPRKADWRKVSRLCEHVLRYQSKDIQISCWYVEALTHLYGLEGMQCGLEFLAKFISLYWATCWPSLEEGLEIRFGKLIRLDSDLSVILKEYPLLDNKGITHSKWYKALAFEHSVSLSAECREELIMTEGDHSVEAFKKTVVQYDTHNIRKQLVPFYDLPIKLDEVEACYFFHTHEDVHKIFRKTRQTINEITELLCRFLPPEEPDITPALQFSTDPGSIQEKQYFDLQECGMFVTPPPMTRDKALEQLELIAYFFRQTEPTSPVPYLIERAVRWSKMSMSEWLEELLKDNESMEQINRILKG